MKYLNKSLLAAALTIAGATSAHADSFVVSPDPSGPGVSTMTWSFNDIAYPTSHAVGTTFDDYFVFNVPDAESISLRAVAVSGVDFSGGGYALWGGAGVAFGGSSNLLDVHNATNPYVVGGSYSLTSGTFVLEVAGTYSGFNGFYAGQIVGIPAAVPEPSSVLMLLAGLAGLAGVARLRKNKA